jgi:glycosyltransferase involved in cell wall biosynthesis|tara:strand:+ start:5606 stop:7243 length:1638 start_codon:yes stop_codon:yes gene_type:complete
MNKKKVLFVTESHKLASGFGTYAKQVLPRLAATGKYELAEFAGYGDFNLVNNLDWLFFGNAPTTDEERKIFDQNPANHFGLWRFDKVVMHFKPDIVLTYRDPWMDQWIAQSANRPYFHWLWMPTVDSAPQRRKWIENFGECDALLAYSEFGAKTLLEQSNNKLNVVGCASPAIDPNIYKPVASKKSLRRSLGIDPEINIVGTVMRNQKRKLFVELMRSFRMFLDNSDPKVAEKTFLYLHTSYPEKAGWDISGGVQEFGLQNKVLATYVCRACANFSCTLFQDAITTCKHCNARAAVMPSVALGLEIPDLIQIYNLFDLYVQYAICEGFGMPQVEAAACGVPVAAVNYSAMEDVVRFTNGYPIKVKGLYREVETGADRAHPDNEHLAKILEEHFSLPESARNRKMLETRKATLDKYDWDKTSKVWEDYIDSYTPTGTQGRWDAPYVHIDIPESRPENMNGEHLVRWCYGSLLKDPQAAYSYEAVELMQSVAFGAHIESLEPFTVDNVWEIMVQRAKNKLLCEQIRTGQQQMVVDEFIKQAYQRRKQ